MVLENGNQSMNAHLVDPRDTRWMRNNPKYRVYFWQPQPSPSSPGWISSEWEIDGCDVDEALAWANSESKGRRFVLYASILSSEGPGLIRLLGDDPLDEASA